MITTEEAKSLLSTYKKELAEKVRGMKEEGKTIYNIGSEFANPRDYKRQARNDTLDSVINLIERE